MRIITAIRGPTGIENKPLQYGVVGTSGNICCKAEYCRNKVVHLWLVVHPVLAAILWKLLNESDRFRLSFALWISNQWIENEHRENKPNELKNHHYLRLSTIKVKSRERNNCLQTKVTLELLFPGTLNITPDIRWTAKLEPLIVEFIQLNDTMSWLSTLGGAYSSLGDQSTMCSQKAGIISKQQLMIAHKLNNPILAAQCNVFLAMSMVQRGHIKLATNMIRQQYRHAISNGVRDSKLIASCKAVWNRINYVKQLKANKKST